MEIDSGPEAQPRGRSRDEKNGCLALIELQVMGQVALGKCSISPWSSPAALPSGLGDSGKVRAMLREIHHRFPQRRGHFHQRRQPVAGRWP